MNLSVCIITKNEKENLKQCLQKLTGYGFELVVVDTGSTDGTIPMALEYTDAVYEFPWCDDFAKAKNYAVSQASNDMVLVLDSDEFVTKIDVVKLEDQLKENAAWVGRIQRKNFMRQNQGEMEALEYINRIFNRNLYHYEGRIHEQLVANDKKAYRTYRAPVEIDHGGYFLSEEEKRNKALRNITLLMKSLEEQGEDPYLLYQLGKSYYMMGEYAAACDCFSRGLSFELEPEWEYVIDMVNTYGYALLNSGRAEEALGFTGIEEAFGNTSDFQFLMGLIYMNNELFEESVEAFLKAISLHKSSVKGTDSYLANYNIGVIYECLSNMEQAVDYYWKCQDYLPAVRRLGLYYEGKNPVQAYLYYRQQAYFCRNFGKQEISAMAETIQSKYQVHLPKTAIVILSYNTLEETRECIESIRQNCARESYELIVVDNASSDGSVEWLRQQTDIRLLCNTRNQGFPAGCNQGIALAEPDSDIWLLNSDTLVPENGLFWLQMGLYDSEKVGACGSVSNYCPNYQNIEEMNVTAENYQDYAKIHPVSAANPYEKKSWLVGFSLLLKRKALSETGLLDERFSPGNFEDTDLGYRMAKAGWRQLLCRNSFVFHYGSRSFGRQREKFTELMRINQQKFIEKWNLHPSRHSYIKTWEAAQIQKQPGERFKVLDLGCGTGATLARVQYMYPKASVFGVEKHPLAAELAQSVAEVIQADAAELKEDVILEESLDYIFTGGIWEHMTEPSRLFQKMNRWLKPEGVLTGSFYNAAHPFQKEVPEKFSDYDIGISDQNHKVYYTAEEWIELLNQNRIVIDDFTYCREAHDRESGIPYQYFWKGHYV